MSKRISSVGVLAALVVLALPAVAAERAGAVAVLNLAAEGGLAEGTTKLLNELLLTELTERRVFRSVIGERDIVSMIQLEEERAKLTGCVDDSCLAEIGGALGVDYIVASNVGRVGEKFLLNVKVLDVRRAQVAARASEAVADEESELIAAMKRVVARICDPFVAAGDDGGANVVAWTVTATGAASVVAGAVLGGVALAHEDDLSGREHNDPDVGGLRDQVRDEALAADVLLGVGLVAAAVGVVLFLVGAGDEETAPGPATADSGSDWLRAGGGRF